MSIYQVSYQRASSINVFEKVKVDQPTLVPVPEVNSGSEGYTSQEGSVSLFVREEPRVETQALIPVPDEDSESIVSKLARASAQISGEQNLSNDYYYSIPSMLRRCGNIVLLILFHNDQAGHSSSLNGLNLTGWQQYVNVGMLTFGGVQLAYRGGEILKNSRNAWLVTEQLSIDSNELKSTMKASIKQRAILKGGLTGLTGVITILNGCLNCYINNKNIQYGDPIFTAGKYTGILAVGLLGLKNFVDSYQGIKGIISSTRNITVMKNFAQNRDELRTDMDRNLYCNLMARLQTQRVKKVVNSVGTSMSWISIAFLIMGILGFIPLKAAVYVYFSVSTVGQSMGLGQALSETYAKKQLSNREVFLTSIGDESGKAREIPAELDNAVLRAVQAPNPTLMTRIIPLIHTQTWSGKEMLTVQKVADTGLQIWRDTLN